LFTTISQTRAPSHLALGDASRDSFCLCLYFRLWAVGCRLSAHFPAERSTVHHPKTTIQPRISTIPCKILYLSANEMLPCLMFSSQSSQSPSRSPGPSPSELSAFALNPCSRFPLDISTFEPYNLQTIHFVSPFPATLTGRPQLHENKTTLSLAFATLTSPVKANPFVCHSCKKHRGVGIPSECHPERSEASAFSRSLSPLPRQSHPAKGNPSKVVSALFLSLVTNHQPPVTNFCTIRTYEKCACKSRRIRTSKTQHLKPFRMNTSEKAPRGVTCFQPNLCSAVPTP